MLATKLFPTPMPPQMPQSIIAPPPPTVITPPKTRGVRRPRGRGRGRPPSIPVMARGLNKVTVSSPSHDESDSDDDIPTTINMRGKEDPISRLPPSEDKMSIPQGAIPPQGYPTNSASPQYPPPSQPTGVISRLLQAPIPPSSNQPFTAAAAASIAAKFYPSSPGNPQNYPPRQPTRYPAQASPINYRPPMRLRGGPPNVGMSYPPPNLMDAEKSLTPPPAYVTRPVLQQTPPRNPQGFIGQRPPFQAPPPYQPNPQAPYFNPYPPVDEPPQQFQPPYVPPDTFTTPQTVDPPTSYEAPPQVLRTGEEEGGEFGGLVSYFSSQREDDLES